MWFLVSFPGKDNIMVSTGQQNTLEQILFSMDDLSSTAEGKIDFFSPQ